MILNMVFLIQQNTYLTVNMNVYYIRINNILMFIFVLESLLCKLVSGQVEEWPTYASDEKDCANLGDQFLPVPQIPWGIPGRAWMTVPPQIKVRTSAIPGGGLGTFSTTFIPISTWLAEYEGEVFTMEDEDIVTEYSWQIYRNETLDYYIDAARIETSNWVRWVNCPRNDIEENVKGVYCYGKVFYITSKPIYPAQELFVYYGDDYAKELGIDVNLFKG